MKGLAKEFRGNSCHQAHFVKLSAEDSDACREWAEVGFYLEDGDHRKVAPVARRYIAISQDSEVESDPAPDSFVFVRDSSLRVRSIQNDKQLFVILIPASFGKLRRLRINSAKNLASTSESWFTAKIFSRLQSGPPFHPPAMGG
jgi:hypothetical protein